MPVGIALKRNDTGGRIGVAGGVVLERIVAVGRVNAASGIVLECIGADGRVAAASGVGDERVITQERVGVNKVAALLTCRTRMRRKRNAYQGESNEKENSA